MKKFKKSEIAIYVIALMLVTAGYFNYTTFQTKTQDTYSNEIINEVDEYANTGDSVLVSNQEIQEEIANNEKDKEELNQPGETEEQINSKTTNSEITNEEDYYYNSKLERNKMYAEMITNYENIISNTNSSEVQKSIATEEIKKINNNKSAIMICENLILTKGFKNCVIFINDDSVNIVAKIEGGLSTEKVAIIQNIISRELNTKIENIHITEK